MSVSCCVCSAREVDCLFVRGFKEVEYEKDLLKLEQNFERKPFPELGPSLVLMRRLFSHKHFTEMFDYWTRDCDFKLPLRLHAWKIFSG